MSYPALSAVRSWPSASRTAAVSSRTRIDSAKTYVGTANARPDSCVPRGFTAVSRPTKARLNETAWAARPGTAEVIAATPATTDTETVSTWSTRSADAATRLARSPRLRRLTA